MGVLRSSGEGANRLVVRSNKRKHAIQHLGGYVLPRLQLNDKPLHGVLDVDARSGELHCLPGQLIGFDQAVLNAFGSVCGHGNELQRHVGGHVRGTAAHNEFTDFRERT